MIDKIYDPFYCGYAVAALWSSSDSSGESFLDAAGYGVIDIAPETAERMITDCDEFLATLAANGISREMLADLYQVNDGDAPLNWAGHDFWFTRNGHGAGFWDRGFGELGDELSEIAEDSGMVNLYVGDDGLIHQE